MSEIKDSGERREFDSGAVRDMSAGKGRCDLLPLDIIACLMQDPVLAEISSFVQTKKELCLINALSLFQQKAFPDMPTMILELAKHFEAGAEKYGEYNWQKGLPLHCYIDSGVRHYLKWMRGDEDEPHSSAFVWNLTCCIWTVKNKPEMDDIYGPTYTLEEVKAELDSNEQRKCDLPIDTEEEKLSQECLKLSKAAEEFGKEMREAIKKSMSRLEEKGVFDNLKKIKNL